MSHLEKTLAVLKDILERGSDRPAYRHDEVTLPPIGEEASTPGEWEGQLRHVIDRSHNPRHPGWMAHMNGAPNPMGVLATLVVETLGNNCLVQAQAPAAYAAGSRLEAWISGLLGWPGMGELAAYESGSIANLHALLEARNRALSTGAFRDRIDLVKRGVVMCSELAHQSIAKAVDILGLPVDNLVSIPTDDAGKMSVDELRRAHASVVQEGRKVFQLTLTMGTTSLGSIDPIADAVAAMEEGTWVHVDGAFGGGLVFARRHRFDGDSFSGVDSFGVNGHKLFNMPCGSGLLVFRRKTSHFSHPLPYTGKRGATETRPNAEWMISGSSRPVLLAVYLALTGMGAEGLAEWTDAHMDRAIALARGVEERGFELLAAPETPVVIFRPSSADDEEVFRLARELELRGVYMSTTRFRDATWIRAVLINSRIRIDRALDLLRSLPE